MIKLNKVGKITKGENAGQYIRIEYDPIETGGFYIYQSATKNFSGENSFDSWVETKSEFESFFTESHWEIDWDILD